MTYNDPITWVDDDGSGATGTALSATHENERERILVVLANAGIAGANLLPDFDTTWWASGGSGIVNTYDVGAPYRLRTGADKTPGKILQCSVQTNATNFLAALNPAANYLWLQPGKTYSWGVWLRSETIARDFRIRSIFFQENGTTQIATPGGEYTALVTSVVGDWIHLVRTVTAPAAAAGQKYVRFRPYVYVNTPGGTVGSPELVYLTEPVLVEGEVVPNFSKSIFDFFAYPVFTGEVTVSDVAGGKLTMIDPDSGADLKRSRWWNSAGSTYLWLANDDGTTKQYPIRIYHDTGRVDFDASAPVPTHNNVPLAKSVSEALTAVNASGGAAPAFGTSYQNKDATRGAVSFYKDTTGRVHLQGVATVKVGGAAANALIFTLPAGYRPSDGKEHWYTVYTSSGIVRVEIDGSSGVVRVPTALAAAVDVSLDGLSFRAS